MSTCKTQHEKLGLLLVVIIFFDNIAPSLYVDEAVSQKTDDGDHEFVHQAPPNASRVRLSLLALPSFHNFMLQMTSLQLRWPCCPSHARVRTNTARVCTWDNAHWVCGERRWTVSNWTIYVKLTIYTVNRRIYRNTSTEPNPNPYIIDLVYIVTAQPRPLWKAEYLQKATTRRADKWPNGHVEICWSSLMTIETVLIILQRHHFAQHFQIIFILLLFRGSRHFEYFDSLWRWHSDRSKHRAVGCARVPAGFSQEAVARKADRTPYCIAARSVVWNS